MSKVIRVEAGTTLESVVGDGPDIVSTSGTVKEAKERAKHYVSAEFAKAAELSSPLGYARVLVDDVCVFDVGE